MKSAPFDHPTDVVAIADFQSHLKSILAANQFAGTRLPANFAADHQVTPNMLACRTKPFADRKEIYGTNRISDQRLWYAKKGGFNKRLAFRWVSFCVLVYVLAIISSLTRAANPSVTWLPTEVFIAIASSIVGWIQIKKFNELSASYILTAHEIGILNGTFQNISNEKDFADFVNEAEQAFSREHTQWVARIS